jgi:hypothetical protein
MILCDCVHLFVLYPRFDFHHCPSIIDHQSVRANAKKIYPESWILIYSEPTDRQPSNPEDEDDDDGSKASSSLNLSFVPLIYYDHGTTIVEHILS